MVATVLALLIAQLGNPWALGLTTPPTAAGSFAASAPQVISAQNNPLQVLPESFPSIDEVAKQNTIQVPVNSESPSIQGLSSAWSIAPTARSFIDQPPNPLFSQSNPFTLSGFQQPVVEGLPLEPQLETHAQLQPSLQGTTIGQLLQPATTPSPIESQIENGDVTVFAPSVQTERESRLRRFFRRRAGPDLGIGFERVMFAPMVLDTAISSPNVGLRMRADYGLNAPDRLEYLWARAGRGPRPETRLDLIDTVYRSELGNSQAAFISEMSMRALNPEQNGNTVGFGDMLLGGKALVYDGRCTKISTIFLTHLKTGSVRRGLGTGHVSLEPGMLLRHKLSDATYFHSELKYRLPIAASAGFGGDVLTTGYGLSTVWKDSDQYALMPTFEVKTHSFLFGSQTRSDGSVERVNGVTAVELFPGMRCVSSKSNVGTWEAGIAGGVTCCDSEWFDSRFVLDLRWLW